jgi:DNA-binding ferritin-like protein
LFEEDGIHITEKTWKAIYLGIPFVVCASLNHLDGLKRMGFQTFHSVIDESYDSRDDHFDKIAQIIDSAVELSKIWDSDAVKSIIEFNKTLYFNEKHRKHIVKTMFLDEITKINRPLVSLI